MLARRPLPPEFARWNRKWGAPFGSRSGRLLKSRIPSIATTNPRLVGLFGIQANNDTRYYEFPWAYHAVPLSPGMTALEIGGGLSGFQFVLAKQGLRVVNVDPGLDASGVGWRCDPASMARLNRAFHTDVVLHNTTLQNADLADDSIDVAFSISAIEHIPEQELPSLMREVNRVLKPGGKAVLTVDLFLDLAPFTPRLVNDYGCNIDVRRLVEWSGLRLEVGREDELFGFTTFDAREVQAQLSELYYGRRYPACAQLLVLAKDTDRVG